jgi:dTDP-4-dehydrorhamnose reductase
MRVLLLGCNGQLGRCLKDQLKDTKLEVNYVSRDQIDVTDFKNTRIKIIEKEPNVIINATAYTSVDKAEEDFLTANLVNHLAVENLANICSKLSCWLVHISTDYVFDGNSKKPYIELDKTNPQNVYGKSKLKGELAIQESGCKHLIIRTAWVYSEYENNFLKKILQLGSNRDKLSIVDDQIGCPTYAQDLAKTIVIILTKLNNSLASGIFHYCGKDPCSWYEFARVIFQEADLAGLKTRSSIHSIRSVDYPLAILRPLFSVLECSKIKNTFDIDPSDWKLGVKNAISNYLSLTDTKNKNI